MRKLNLQLFAGGHSVTVQKDAHMTTASASSTSDVQKDATVTLTLTPASGYEVADVQVLAGGVTIHEDSDVVTFTMGEADVVIVVTSQADNEYKVTENRNVYVNGVKTALVKNVTVVYAENGAIADVECSQTAVTLNAETIADLVAEGVLVKNHPACKGEPTPAS